MKKIFYILVLLLAVQFGKAQYVNIPDAGFRSWLNANGFSTCMSGNNLDTTCSKVVSDTTLQITSPSPAINDFTGLQYFKSLKYLTISSTAATTLPALPHTLISLNLTAVNTRSLSNLPPNITSLEFYQCRDLSSFGPFPAALQTFLLIGPDSIGTLPGFPTGLTDIEITGSYLLTSMPTFPAGLKKLVLQGASITNLPIIPSGVTQVKCAYDSTLVFTAPLPSALQIFVCNYCKLTQLPSLPNNLQILDVEYNLLSQLPALPTSLTQVNCRNNRLVALPAIPNFVATFLCDTNTSLTCLPQIPTSVSWLGFNTTGITCVPNYASVSYSDPVLTSLPLCQPDNAHGCLSLVPWAGPDQTLCRYTNPLGSTFLFTMAATGIGNWTAVAGNPTHLTITDTTFWGTQVRGAALPGVYGFIWTSGGLSDTMKVTVLPVPPKPVLTQTSACLATDTLVLHGNTSNDSITWWLDTHIVATTSARDSFFRPTVSNDPYTAEVMSPQNCGSLYSDSITIYICSTAGPNQTICQGATVTMAATGTGTWSQVSNYEPESVNIISPGSPTSQVSGFYIPGVYGFVWSGAAGDTIFITTVDIPTTPVISVVGGCLGHDSLLALNILNADSLVWAQDFSEIARTAVTDSFFIPTLPGNYEVAAISAAGCGSFYSDSVVVYVCDPAGPDQTVCVGSGVNMAANGTGTWMQTPNYYPDPVAIMSINSPTTHVQDFYEPGVYGFVWSGAPGDTVFITVISPVQTHISLIGSCLGHDSLLASNARNEDSLIWMQSFVPVATVSARDSFYVPTQPGYYELEGISAQGCIYGAGDSVLVASCDPAGPNQTICTGTIVTMAATATGTWSQVSNYEPEPVNIISPNSPTSQVSGFYIPGVYGFVWSGAAGDTIFITTVDMPATPVISLVGGCLGRDSLLASNILNADSLVWAQDFSEIARTAVTDSFFIPTLPGNYEVAAISAPGCGSFYSDSVVVPTCSSAGSNQTICYFGTATMAASGTGSWHALPSNPSVATITTPSSPTTTITDFIFPGVYGFVWGALPGDTVYVTVTPAIKPVLTSTGLCLGSDTLTVHGAVSTDSIIWIFDNFDFGTPGRDSVYIPTTASPFIVVELISANGCHSYISDTVAVLPCSSAGPNQTACWFGSATMAATGTGSWYALSSNPAVTTIVTPSSPTTTISNFTALGVYGFVWGTLLGDTVFVTVSPPVKPVLTLGGNCLGSDTLTVHGALSTDSIIWFFDTFSFGTSGRDSVYLPGTASPFIAVELINSFGCQSYVSDTVSVVECTRDTINICRGSSYQMHNSIGGSNASTYLWVPSSGLSSNAVLNPVASPAVTTLYTLIAIDTTGLAYYDTVLVTVDSQCLGFVWPGDADDNGIVNNTDLLPIGLTYGFTGAARPQRDINWYAHSATPWAGTNSGGINNVYSDCDGNDSVNINDVLAILQNYSLIHAKTDERGSERSGAPVLKMVIMPDTLLNGDTLTCHIILGDSTVPANNVYGLAFTFNFNPIVVDSNSLSMTFPDSWLATQSQHITLAKNDFNNGAIHAGLSRINQVQRSGSGQIASVSMVITTDNIDGKNMSYYAAQFSITGVKMINQLGDTIPVNTPGDSAIIGFIPTAIQNDGFGNVEVKLFPDPANNSAQIRTNGAKMSELVLTDVLGRQVQSYYQINAANFILPTVNLNAGVYFAQITIGNNTLVKKFLVQH